MKIILIRQAETDMPWAARYSAADFEAAAAEEQRRAAAVREEKKSDALAYRVYTGTSAASRETAERLFTLREPPIATALLDDVPLRAYRDGEASRPLWLWRTMRSIQWAAGSSRQAETRTDTLRRVREFVDLLEAEERDSIVVCRGLTMSALKAMLRAKGYCLEGGDLLPKPLERVRASKRSLHCGGCAHNCLLSEAKCPTGQSKAKGIR